MRALELFGALFWFVLSLYVSAESYRMGLGTWHNPGDGYFSFGAGLVLAVMSLSLLIKELPKLRQKSSLPVSEQLRWKNVILIVVAMFLYALLFARLGFILCTFLLIVFLLRFIGSRSWVTSIIAGFLVTLSSYVLFNVLLKTGLPKGFFGL